MTFNIHKGKHPVLRRETLKPMRDFIASHSVDLVLLQEVIGSNPKKEFTDQVRYLGEGLQSEFCYGKNAIVNDYHHGNAILSRYPIVESKNYDLTTNSFEKRGMLQATITIKDRFEIQAFCCHLNLLRNSRKNQIHKISELLAESSESFKGPMFAGGDFNDWLKDAHEPFFTRGWKEAGHEGEKKHLLTFPSFWPRMALDRLYFRAAKLRHADVPNFGKYGILSDHLPILAEFELG